jgi:hypothetical protein
MTTKLLVGLGNPTQHTLEFALESDPITKSWLKLMPFRNKWPLDDPTRFYGFGTVEEQQQRAEHMILNCIDKINQHQHIITRPFTSIHDQDHLNYLHNIFELHHGTLDKQNSDFWKTADSTTKQALADLNTAVHRCEYLIKSPNRPRFKMTWHGMPKLYRLDLDLQKQYGQMTHDFGGVYLCIAGIGKRVVELATDNDNYANLETMFFYTEYYSADFEVHFYNTQLNSDTIQNTIDMCTKYYYDHHDFFLKRGITDPQDPRIQPVVFKLAQLIYEPGEESVILDIMNKHQYVSSITLV